MKTGIALNLRPVSLRSLASLRHALGAQLLVLLAMLLFAPTPALSQQLVDNIPASNATPGGAISVGFGRDVAQGFGTGGHSDGYTVTSVGMNIRVSSSGATPVYTVGIWSASSGVPNTRLGTLTVPDSIVDGVNTFTTSGIDLAANTTYFVVVDVTTEGAVQAWRATSSQAENNRKAPGWSISDFSHRRAADDSGGWSISVNPGQMRISGVARNATNIPPVATNSPILRTVEDTEFTYDLPHLRFYDADDGDALVYVRIVTLPASDTGTLTLNGANVSAGDSVSPADIAAGHLKYIPPANAHGRNYASFTFKVSDGTDESATYTVTMSITPMNDPATGAPTISGIAQVGQTLTAQPGDIADLDGLASPNYRYQWIQVDGDGTSNPTNITGAALATYTPVTEDVGKKLKVKVTFTDDGATSEARESAPTPTVTVLPVLTIRRLSSGANICVGLYNGEDLDVSGRICLGVFFNGADSTGFTESDLVIQNGEVVNFSRHVTASVRRIIIDIAEGAGEEFVFQVPHNALDAGNAPAEFRAQIKEPLTVVMSTSATTPVTGNFRVNMAFSEHVLIDLDQEGVFGAFRIGTSQSSSTIRCEHCTVLTFNSVNADALIDNFNIVVRPEANFEGRLTLTMPSNEVESIDTPGEAFGEATLQVDVDTKAPSVTALTLGQDRASVILSLHEAPVTLDFPGTADFSVISDGRPIGIVEPVIVNAKEVSLSLSEEIAQGAILTLSYNRPSSRARLRDALGNATPSFTHRVDAGTPEVTITVDTATAAEGETSDFTLSRTGGFARTLTVQVKITETGDMISPTPPDSVTFEERQSTAALSVPTDNDRIDEADSIVTATVTADTEADARYRAVAPAAANVTVNDDDVDSTQVTLTIKPTKVRENVPATEVAVTAELNGAARGEAIPVVVSIGAGSGANGATPGTDFTAVDDFTITIAPGTVAATQTFTMEPADDGLEVNDETVTVSGTTTVADLTVSAATLTITEDAFRPEAPASVTATGGDSAARLEWVSPASDGGAPIVKYQYRISADGGVRWNPDWTDAPDANANNDRADERSAIVRRLLNDRQYTFEVRAVNGVGGGDGARDTAMSRASACPAPDFAGRRRFWTGALSVEPTGAGSYGFDADAGAGGLTPRQFTIGSNRYTVRSIHAVPGAKLGLRLNATLTQARRAALRLHVCDEPRDFSAATESADAGGHEWNANLDWSLESTRTLYLSLSANHRATGAPAISGTAVIGHRLTADRGSMADEDGLPSSLTYQWERVDDDGTSNPTDIEDATAETYTLTETDVGKKIRVKVSFTDDLNGVETRTSAAYPAQDTVDEVATVVSVAVTSTPRLQASGSTTPDTYGVGERIEFTMIFSEAVTVTEDPTFPQFRFTLDVNGARFADYDANASTATKPVFAYTVQAVDTDTTGVWIGDSRNIFNDISDDRIRTTSNNVNANLRSARIGTQSGHKVDGARSSQPVISVADVSGAEGDAITFTIRLTPPATAQVTVSAAASAATGDTATAADFTAPSATVTFSAGDTEKTFTVSTLEDRISEGDDTFTVTLSGVRVNPTSAASLAPDPTATGTIIDDDEAPVLVLTVEPASVAEAGGTARATVNTGDGSTFPDDQTVTLALSGTATETDDYTISSKSLTLSAGVGSGVSSVTATVTAVDDALYEGDETVLIDAALGTGDMDPAVGTRQTLTIIDDDRHATGAPAITGTAQVGMALSASPGTIADADGLAGVSYSYQWVRVDADGMSNPLDIGNATSATYTPMTDDAGKTLKVRASFTDDAGFAEQRTSAPTATVFDPTAGICGRTEQVRNALVALVTGVSSCADVTAPHLAAITGDLRLGSRGITALAGGDFDGLIALRLLDLSYNALTTLPDDVFEPLTSLTSLALRDNPGAPFAPEAAALPDDGTVPLTWGTVTLDGSGSDGGPWGTNVTYGWALTDPASGVTVTFDDATSATTVVTIPEVAEGTELAFTLTVTGRGGTDGIAPATATATVTATASDDAKLSALTVNDGTSDLPLAPAFASGTFAYAADVATTVDEVTLSATANQAGASVRAVTLNGTAIADSDFTDGITVSGLLVGGNDIVVTVMAEDTASTRTYTVTVTRAVNIAPTASVSSVTTNEDTEYTFAAADFNFDDTDSGDTLVSVRIVTLPASDKGTLTLNGANVSANDSVTTAQLRDGNLKYIPPANAHGGAYASFAFRVHDGTDESAAAYTMTVNVTAMNDPATGAPAISGAAQVSRTLTAATTGIADVDGLTSPSYGYQWIRVDADGTSNPEDITGAMSSTYTPVRADVGNKLRVKVSFTDDDSNDEELTSEAHPSSGTIVFAGICARTLQVRDALVALIPVVSHCADVTATHLAAITGTLRITRSGITALAARDFDGLTGVTGLAVSFNALTTLPDGVFDELTSLRQLYLQGNQLSTLPDGVFDELTSLTDLVLAYNDLTTLRDDVFDGLTSLSELSISYNDLTTLPDDVFDGLTSLSELSISWNDLTTLPDDVFDGLTSLEELYLNENDLATLPADVFDGLTALTDLSLSANDLTTLPDDVFEPLTALTDLALGGNPGAPFAPEAVALPDDGTVSNGGGMVTLDGSGSGGPWGTNVTYGWALTDPVSGVTVTFDDAASATPEVTIPEVAVDTELTFTLTVTGRGGTDGIAPATDTATVTAAASDDAKLSALTVNDGTNDLTLAPPFASGTFVYAADVATTVDEVTLSATVNHAGASVSAVTLNGTAVADSDFTDGITVSALLAGGNDIVVTVTAQDTSSTRTYTVTVTRSANIAPTASASSVTTNEDTEYTFAAADFNFDDTDSGDALASVTVVTLPAEGALELDGTAVTTGQSVPAADIGKLVFTPAANGNGAGYASFTFRVHDGTDESASAYVMTVNVTAMNDPATGAPTISGTAQMGQTLAAATTGIADVDGLTSPTYGYQWIRVDADGTSNPTDIVGAASGTYTQVRADVGKKLRVKVSFTDDDGNDEELTSAPTATETVLDPTVGICGRTPQVRDALVALIPVVSNCADVTATHLAAITGTLRITRSGITALAARDFDGLTGVTGLAVSFNALTTLPDGVFDELTSLRQLYLQGNQLSTLPDGVFDELTSLTDLVLASNDLTTLRDDVFDGLTSLSELSISYNDLTTLPDDVFDGLTALTDLALGGNPGAPFAPEAVALPDDGTVPAAGGTVTLDGSGSGGRAWGTHVTYGWALTDPASGVTVTFDDAASATPVVTIPALATDTELTFTLTVTGRGGTDGIAPATDTATVTATASNDAKLSALTVNDGTNDLTLAPVFASGTFVYAADVATTVDEVTLSATVNHAGASVSAVTLNGTAVADSDFTDGITVSGLLAGGNDIVVTVTAEDTSTTRTYTVTVTANTAPTAFDASVTTNEDTAYTFGAADFNFDDTDTGDALASVTVVTLPAEGSLTLDGPAVTTGQSVPAADIGKLVFTPAANGHGDAYASFTFRVHDGTDESASSYVMTVNVTAMNDPATGAPTISGAARVGQVLTADASGIADIDGLPAVSAFAYRWIRVEGGSDTEIPAATSGTYRLVAGDVDKKLKVRVSFTDLDGHAEALTSAAYPAGTQVSANTAPTASDETVTVEEDSSYRFQASDFGFADTDGDALGSVKITALPLAGTLELDATAVTTGQSVPAADIGKLVFTPAANGNGDAYASFTFRVHDGTDESAASYVMTVNVTAMNDPATGAPTISGTAQVGQTLTAATTGIADVDGLTSPSYGYQWILVDADGTSNPTDIAGAASSTYMPVRADVGNKLRVKVSFTDDDRNDEDRTSAATATVLANTAPTAFDASVTTNEDTAHTFAAADFNFTDSDGDALASVTVVTLPAEGSLTLDGPAVTAGQSVPAADIGKLVFTPAANAHGDAHARFTFRVHDGTDESAASYVMTVNVTAMNDPATGAPTISGTAQVGQTLTAATTGIADVDGLTSPSYGYQWIRVDADGTSNPTDITGATLATYTPVRADVGNKLRVKVSFTDDDRNDEELTSAATATVLANTAPRASASSVTTNEDTAYTFAAADFNFTDSDGNALASVTVVTLPAEGSLTLDGTAVTAGQSVPAADIGKLVFTPAANAHGDAHASFTFRVHDGTDESASAYTMTVNVTAMNDPATGAPTISGTAQVGQTLTAATTGIADVDGLTSPSYGYQWIRVDADGTSNPTDITGATLATYTPVRADVGNKLRVKVSFTDDDR